jgi:heterotetrameric sarcosine oxidase delta subunit
MLLINCPYCGERAQTEFDYVRTLDSIVMLDMEPEAAMTALFERTNPRGEDDELWRHSHGCRQFVTLRRNRVTHEILFVKSWGQI